MTADRNGFHHVTTKHSPRRLRGPRVRGHNGTNRQARSVSVLLLVAASIGAGPVWGQAQTSWVVDSGDWFVESNWNNGVPDESTDAIIGNDGTVTVDSEGAEVDRIRLNLGAMEVIKGGTVTSGRDDIGSQPGTEVSLVVSGETSEWSSNGTTFVGRESTTTMRILAGAQVTTGNRGIVGGGVGSGGGAGGEGTVEVSGGSEWLINDQFYAGASGDGAVQIISDGRVSAPEVRIGNLSGVEGEILVTGNAARLQIDGEAAVGRSGIGRLIVEDGGMAEGDSGRIGSEPDGNGEAGVTGEGSQWTLDGFLVVGDTGTGSLVIEDGGRVTTTVESDIGLSGEGAVRVSGADSEWHLGNASLFIGDAGLGTLTLENGGALSAVDTVSLSGAGSDSIIRIGAGEGAGVLDASSINFGASTARLVFDHVDDPHTFVPGLEGEGTIEVEAGRTILTGDAAGFTGTTTVNGGSLRIDSHLGGFIQVQSGGRLEGSGTLGTTDSAGTIVPGTSIGTLTIDGNLTLASSAVLALEVDDPSGSDQVAVGGDLTLDGTAEIIDPGGLEEGVYTLLTHAGELTDNGLDLTGLPAGLEAAIDTTEPGEVRLVVQGDPEPALPVSTLNLPGLLVLAGLLALLAGRVFSSGSAS